MLQQIQESQVSNLSQHQIAQQHLQRFQAAQATQAAQAQRTSSTPPNVSQSCETRLVEMSHQQYTAFMQFQSSQQNIHAPATSVGALAKATPSASSSGAPPAFNTGLRPGNPGPGKPVDLITLHSSSSSSSREREDQPPPKKAKEKTPLLLGSAEEDQIKNSKAATRPKAPEIKSPNRQQPPPVNALWRCPTCGTVDTSHDVMNCTLPRRHDLSPSLSQFELTFLLKLDQTRRAVRHLQHGQGSRQGSGGSNDDDNGSESLGSRSAVSESEQENEEDRSFVRDSEDSYQVSSPGASSTSRSRSQSSSSAPRPATAKDERMDKMERMLMLLSDKILAPSSAGSASHGPATRDFPSRLDLSSWQTPQGMVGIPEMKRADLLKLSEFEALEKKYTDYCDKAQMHRRTPQPIAQCFGKFLPDIKLSINSLLSRNEAVRKKFRAQLQRHDYKVTEQILNDMSTQDFSNLYRELVTTRTFMASELLSYLMSTPFQRTAAEGQEEITLTLVVLQASTAFRERLETCPTQTVKKCTPIQFRDAFVKMVLGNDERHLADFLHCDSWDEAAQTMMDLEGSGQGVTFLKKVQKKAVKSHDETDKDKPEKPRAERDKDKDSRKTDKDQTDWEKAYKDLSATIEHNETEMRGHTQSYKDRVKRLLALRDARAREVLLISMEKGGSQREGSAHRSDGRRADSGSAYGGSYGGHRAEGERGRAEGGGGHGGGQTYGQRQRSHSPRHYQDHRDYEVGSAPTYSRSQQFDRSHGHEAQLDRGSYRQDGFQSPRQQQPRGQSPRGGASDRGQISDQQQDHEGAYRQATSQPPSKSQITPSETTVRRCYNCGGEGHLASNCPKIGGDGGSVRRHASGSRSPSRP